MRDNIMKTLATGATLVALSATTTFAAGLDRSGQSVAAIFDAPGTTNVSFGVVSPTLKGSDITGSGSYEVGESYMQLMVTHTRALNDKLSYSVIVDHPYGADIDYNDAPTASMLGGTGADLGSQAVTFVGRYKFSDRFSVHAGVGAERIEADVQLNGLAYAQAIATGAAPVPALIPAFANAFLTAGGYDFHMEASTKPTYLIGAAYEIPEIALRIAGTYRFETEHKADTVETMFGVTTNSSVEFVTPQSFNFEAQTGIAPGTLLTASYRWTEFSAVDLIPTTLGSDLVNLDDGHRYTLGVARQFSDKLAASATLSYEPEQDELVSPLGPTNGLFGISLGARFVDGPMKFSAGVNYSWLGDAKAEVADTAVASFEDNHVIGIGVQASFNF
jgi:long-subunit fatty acid transport protein